MDNRLAERMRDLWRKAVRRKMDHRQDLPKPPTLDLPFTNTRETCDLLKTRLAEFNREEARLEPRERLRHLEAFREPVEAVVERLQQMTQDITLPVRSTIVDTALGARSLYVELALGYKSVLNDICGPDAEVFDIEMPGLAVHGGIQALSNVLNLSYALYWPAPAGIWRELHQFYQFAERNHMVEPTAEQTAESMATTYKSTLLLWLANPYGLTPNEQHTARHLIGQWAHLAEIRDTYSDEVHFVVLTGDSPPMPSSWHPGAEAIQSYLCTEKLCETLRHHAEDRLPLLSHTPPPPIDFDANAIAQRLAPDFVALWCGKRRRRSERRQSAVSRLMTVGLGSSHYFLSNRRRLGETQQVAANRASTSTVSSASDDAPSESRVLPRSAVFRGKPSDTPSPYRIHSANMNRPAASLIVAVEPAERRGGAPRETGSHAHLETTRFGKSLCRIINDSTTGACLLIRGGPEASLRIGELISLFALGDEKYRPWGIGTIRWLRHFHGHYVMVGVERLVHQATAVATKVCDPSGKYSDYLRSLLITDYGPGDRSASAPTLITANVPYRTGDTILMHYLGEEKRLILGPTVRSTARFRQFTFEDPDAFKATAANAAAR